MQPQPQRTREELESMTMTTVSIKHSQAKERRRHQWMIWIPVGLLSFIYLVASPNAASDERTDPSAIDNAAESSMKPPAHLEYRLLENATVMTTRGEPRSILRYATEEILDDGSRALVSPLRWAELLGDPDGAEENIRSFVDILANAPMNAYFFETIGYSYPDSRDRPFRFVLVDSPHLYRFADSDQDPEAFRGRFDECRDSRIGCVFSNPGGDSELIAPMKMDAAKANAYGHLAAFVRRAPSDQVVQFWKLVAQAYIKRIKSEDPQKVWLSTDGTGVAWLHVRLDPRPKYYDYSPYAYAADGE